MSTATTIHAYHDAHRPFRIGQRVSVKGVLVGSFITYANYGPDGQPTAGTVKIGDNGKAITAPLTDIKAYVDPEERYERTLAPAGA